MKRTDLRDILMNVFLDMSSADPHVQSDAIYRAYTEDAIYEHPMMVCTGIDNIVKAQDTWTSLFHDECQVQDILIDDLRAIVTTRHTIIPKMIPFVKVPLCKVSTLELRNTLRGCVRIDRQVDNVAIADTVARFPIAGWLVNNLIRPAAFQGWVALGSVLGNNHPVTSTADGGENGSGRSEGFPSSILNTAMLHDLAAPYVDWAKQRLGLGQSSNVDTSATIHPTNSHEMSANVVAPPEN
ncbi:hypothetical protein BDF19DRAFT_441917 [Syncephalis fuscata]|nr:hypothetical protein BDF19DRAFT_441917 [Syncephalis fuscata]